MNEMQAIAFEIITNIGVAKSLFMEVIQDIENEKTENIHDKLKEADEYLINGHKQHMSLVQKEASGESLEYSLLLVHAEDQLMNCETIKILAERIIKLYEVIRDEKDTTCM